MELLNRLYTNLDNASAFAGADKLYEAASEENPSITRDQVEKFLEQKRTYTIHKPRRLRYTRLRTIPKGFFTDFQVDLADFQKLAKFNDKYKYMLVGTDVLSRGVYAVPVMTKKGADMKRAFDQLFAQLPALPWTIFSDLGGEFESREMKSYFKSKDIAKHSSINIETKASMAERMIQTVKHRLYKYFTEKRTLRWVDVLDKITNAINNTVNRATGLRPVDVNFENAAEVWKRLYGGVYPGGVKSKLKEGDVVRLSREKETFRKGYLPTFSSLTFDVAKIKRTRPVTYRVKDPRTGREFGKNWYKEELARAVHGKDLKVEKVLRERTNRAGAREFLVKWKGEPIESASWITEGDVGEP
jgi:hypothetical protein